jgi:hypothetical protein
MKKTRRSIPKDSHLLSLCSFLNVTDQVSHPYKTTGKIVVIVCLHLYVGYVSDSLQTVRYNIMNLMVASIPWIRSDFNFCVNVTMVFYCCFIIVQTFRYTVSCYLKYARKNGWIISMLCSHWIMMVEFFVLLWIVTLCSLVISSASQEAISSFFRGGA